MTLLARLEAAEAGSHELDLAIAQWCYDGAARDLVNYDPELWLQRNGGFTDSIDAAKALIERVLPGWVISLTIAGSGEAYLCHPDPCGPQIKAFGNTPALAMCIALLRAKSSMNNHTESGKET